MILLAIGAAGMLGVVNTLLKSGFNKVIAIALASPILLIFMIVAFFEVSELALVPFLCKMLRSHVFDVTKKFQCFFPKTSEERLMLQKRQYTEKTEEIHYKTNTIDKELLEKMESG
ncbi:hypothetical protein GW750_03955 [bacterium]|nr:hypothetical protein [bacterium]